MLFCFLFLYLLCPSLSIRVCVIMVCALWSPFLLQICLPFFLDIPSSFHFPTIDILTNSVSHFPAWEFSLSLLMSEASSHDCRTRKQINEAHSQRWAKSVSSLNLTPRRILFIFLKHLERYQATFYRPFLKHKLPSCQYMYMVDCSIYL